MVSDGDRDEDMNEQRELSSQMFRHGNGVYIE